MAAHNDLGRKGEEKAVEYLVREGYVVLERNWEVKTPGIGCYLPERGSVGGCRGENP